MSAEGSRPWWASDAVGANDLDVDEDPIEAVRRARNGAPAGPRPGGPNHDETEVDDPGESDLPGFHDQHPDEPHGHREGICGVCPLCAGWRLLSETRPEVVDHLTAAGRHLADARPEVAAHLAAAGRHLASALQQLLQDDGPAREEDAPFERIDLDGGGEER